VSCVCVSVLVFCCSVSVSSLFLSCVLCACDLCLLTEGAADWANPTAGTPSGIPHTGVAKGSL